MTLLRFGDSSGAAAIPGAIWTLPTNDTNKWLPKSLSLALLGLLEAGETEIEAASNLLALQQADGAWKVPVEPDSRFVTALALLALMDTHPQHAATLQGLNWIKQQSMDSELRRGHDERDDLRDKK